MIVNEAGASVYSASKLAAEEFPQYDVNLRSAVSIARRLQDPLAELVKIDPKAIGVGQYQHDMPEKELDERARRAWSKDCVNAVGVDVNTASMPLLKQVSGLNATIGKEHHRLPGGKWRVYLAARSSRRCRSSAPRHLSSAAGFLRVPESAKCAGSYGRTPGVLQGGGGASDALRTQARGRRHGRSCRSCPRG